MLKPTKEKSEAGSIAVVKWSPPKGEWEPDSRKPFVIQVLKKAVLSGIVDIDFVIHFKNSLAIMCEVWLRRRGIDPTINTSKNFHKLQDEFLKVLAHINRGFETEIHAEWRGGIGKLLGVWKQIEKEAAAQWIDHVEERRRGDPASRYELKDEPKQDVADAFWVSMFKKGLRWKERTLERAKRIDAQQSKFFMGSFDIEEQKTFTETRISLLNNTQEEWVQNSLSAKLGLRRGYDFLEETLAPSLLTLKEADRLITEGNAKLWLINSFFQLHKRDWNYLLGTLTGGHVALERLFGCLIATLLIGRDRKAFELREDEAEDMFTIFWQNQVTLPTEMTEKVLRGLHQSILNSQEYRIFSDSAALQLAIQASDTRGKRYKTFLESGPILKTLDTLVQKVLSFPLNGAEEEGMGLPLPIRDEKSYVQLTAKLELLRKVEMEIHKVVEDIFWRVVETFSDLVRAYKLQTKKELSLAERDELKAIATRHHLRHDETNFLMYAPDRCYLGTELRHFRGSEQEVTDSGIALRFEAKTQRVKSNYLTPPVHIRRELSALCGRYGKLIGDVRVKSGKDTMYNLRMIWNPPKIQITDVRSKSIIQLSSRYEITITQAEPRKPREKWE